MTYTKESPEWWLIRANTGSWFSKESMRFWESRIYWNTLTKIDGGWLFISSEKDIQGIETRFSIRKVNKDYGLETLEFQVTPNLKIAKEYLKSHTKLEGQN